MTEVLDVAIAEALFNWLAAAPALSGVPRATPFVAFPPTVGVPFLDVRPIMSAAPAHYSLDFAGSDILTGIFQVDAVVPDAKGQNVGMRLASLVADRFVIGTTLTVLSTIGTRKLKVLKVPTTAAALKDAAWIRFPVSIPWQVIT